MLSQVNIANIHVFELFNVCVHKYLSVNKNITWIRAFIYVCYCL